MTRWHYLDPALLWLYPIAFLLHVAEELLARPTFRHWMASFTGRPISLQGFLVINIIAFLLIVAGVRFAASRQRAGWIAVALGVLFLLNFALHLGGSLLAASYSPGLVSATVVYLPLGLLTLLRAASQAPTRQLAAGVVVSAVAQALVTGLAWSGRL